MFISIVFLTAVVVFVVMLILFIAVLYKEGRLNDIPTLSSLMGIIASQVSKVKKRNRPEPVSVSPFPALSLDADKPENALSPGKLAGGVFAGISITALLMAGFTLVLLNAYKYITGSFGLADAVWVIGLVTIGVAGGGAIGFRIAPLSWRQVVIAGLLSGACIMLLSKYEFSPFFPGPWSGIERGFDIRPFLLGAFFLSAPVFSLPLFDPAVRKNGVAPSLNGVALAALGVTVFCIMMGFLSSGLGTLVMGFVFTALSLGIGMVSVLINPTEMLGAWIGGLGILLPFPIILAWYLLGAGWFP